ncbi:MAG: COX aromatic rich motif-containing protein [Candidatus Doudnabacteria bacterium]|nr:COX aromatic rich motif-containing protein [Candidatus Doudnabacteria bacterium]
MSKKQKIIILYLVVIDVFLLGLALWFFVWPKIRLVNFALLQPAGEVAIKEYMLFKLVLFLMLVVAIPLFCFAVFILKRRKHEKISLFEKNKSHEGLWQIFVWLVPVILIFSISVINWKSTHDLDPYKPLSLKKEPIVIQVVALNWKWLFIYPNERIATINFLQVPEQTPIEFNLTADAPMNSFWIPRLGGQMYSMAGMTTKLHLQADQKGDFEGFAAEINGRGFADMNFVLHSVSETDYGNWLKNVKSKSLKLTLKEYERLSEEEKKHEPEVFSFVEDSLYEKIMEKFMPDGGYMPGMPSHNVDSLDNNNPSFSY